MSGRLPGSVRSSASGGRARPVAEKATGGQASFGPEGGPGEVMREEVTPVRVRYPEVDRMGVAHHVHYLEWFERGRTELMRSAGAAYAQVEDEMGLQFPVVEAGARYRRPARYDDLLEVRTRLAPIAGPRVRFEYRVVRPAAPAAAGPRGNVTGAHAAAGDSELLAEGFTVHAAVGRDGRPCRVPEGLRRALEGWAGRETRP